MSVLKAVKKTNAEINIIFVSNQKIRALNRAYLGKDRATDVIAWEGSPVGPETKKFSGDIAISSDMAFRNAAVFGTTFREEIALYVIHGILHLAGYDDTTTSGREKMRRKEDELLQKVSKFL